MTVAELIVLLQAKDQTKDVVIGEAGYETDINEVVDVKETRFGKLIRGLEIHCDFVRIG